MKTIGSQKRELLSETNYTLIELKDNHAILFDKETEKYEAWILNDNFAGYVIEINGKGYEFYSGLI